MISIITSLYRSDATIQKYQKYLLHCARNLEKRNIPFEVICIVNDSTALEKKVCGELARNSWFRLYEVPRETLYASWNRGVSLARGSVCTFWNADDQRFAEGLIEASELPSKGDVMYFPFIYKRYIEIFHTPLLVKRKIFRPPSFNKKIFTREMHCGPFFAFTKSFFEKIGPFNEAYTVVGDFEWCIRAAKTGTFILSSTIAGIFTNNGRTLSGNARGKRMEEQQKVLSTLSN